MQRIKTKEAPILAQIKQLLRLLEGNNKLMFVRVHTMPIIRGGGRGQRYYTKNVDMAGHPDLYVVVDGRIGYIETKATKGVLTTEQKDFRDRILRANGLYCVARSLDDAIKFLKEQLKVNVAFTQSPTP